MFLSEVGEECLIFGLGNPGTRYVKTRHNMGFRAVEYFANRHRISLSGIKFSGLVNWGCGFVAGVRVHLLIPVAYYMNESGLMIRKGLKVLGINRWIVVVDDVRLPFGVIRLKERGSDGGHKGLGSICQTLHSSEFCRFRLGVGEPSPDELLSEYVLEPLYPTEEVKVPLLLERVSEVLDCWVEKGSASAMMKANRACKV